MVICQGTYLACICGLYFTCQDTGKALPLTCQLALKRAWHLCKQVAITVCMHKVTYCHPPVAMFLSARATLIAQTRRWDDMDWRLENADMPERTESARVRLAPQRYTAMMNSRSARDIIGNIGPGMRYTLQGHRIEGCRSPSPVSAMSDAGASSLSLRSPLRPLIP